MREVLDFHEITLRDMTNAFMTGFDIAVQAGPLFEEPILGAAFIVESIDKTIPEDQSQTATLAEEKI